MPKINLEQYYNRFDPDKNYVQHLFRADRTLQSAELNETQGSMLHHLKGVADALLSNGDILRDCRVVVNENTGEVSCESGAVYIEGLVRGVRPASLIIPTTGTLAIGIYLQTKVVTELEDPDLYNPAVGTRGEGEQGAARLQVEAIWGFAGDGQHGEFYPVYTVDDGALRVKEAPPNLDSISRALSDYDRDSAGGTYIVGGLQVLQAADTAEGLQVYTVAEGRARVFGYPVELTVSRRLTRKANPDLLAIDSEPHLSASVASQRITLDRYPVAQITQVRITKETTENVTHGGYSGCSDPLANTSVVEIVEVKQGGVTFSAGTDYKLTASKVDWSPSGQEPPPHSTFTVTYRHITTVTASEADLSGFSVVGAVVGSQILVNYTQMLPRIDKLCISREGEFVWVEGVAAEWNPQPPRVPDDMLAIATVNQTWDNARRVQNNGVATVPMDKLAGFSDRLDIILHQTAQNRLVMDAFTREAGAKKGLWVDPCLDDSMRDQGLEQSAAIVNNAITLPVAVAVISGMPDDIATPRFPDYTLVPVLEQLLRTATMLVNPYHAFEPLPAFMTLTPAIDRWTDVQTKWASPLTQVVNAGHYVPTFPGLTLAGQSSSTSTQTLSTSTTQLANLRQIDVAFRGTGFARNELVDVTFDGLAVTTTPDKADDSGVFAGTFTIPANIPAGAKQVLFNGHGGTKGSAVFSGQGQLTVQTLRNVVTTVLTWHDPLAQTFVLDAACMVAAVDLWFTARGTSNVVVQVRETSLGLPTQTVLCEQILSPGDLVLGNNATRVKFAAPVMLQPATEYCLVVMCDDGVTSLAIAELGKSDPYYGQWVMSQPYQVGVLLSSSNASTWTPHQDKDMTFRLLKAEYPITPIKLDLGSIDVAGVTDMLVMGIAEQPAAATRVEYQLTMPDASVLTLSDMQPVRFIQPVTGPVSIAARLSGTASAAPILHPGTQFLAGITAQKADYITRAVPAGQDSRVQVIIDAILPAGAGLKVSMGEDGAWTEMPFKNSSPLDEGWQELVYEATTDELLVRVKLDLSGTPTARPMATNVRVMTI